MRRAALAALGLALAAAPAAAQPGPPPAPAAAPVERFDDPWDAYAAGAFDQAVEGFVDLQVERPDDPVAALNLGSAQYKLGDYAAAERSFAPVASAADPELREAALYNLGNCAFRQGRLTDAVELYKGALEIDPEDMDAKFNLEYVRNEIRRRHEEAQKRERQQQRQQQGDDSERGEESQEGDQEQPEEGGGERPEAGPDADRDGLSDELEVSAENPTDPQNPDSDGDGLRDGEEDRDRDGRVGAGETDPNNPDSDGDGIPDGAEAAAEGAGEAGAAEAELAEGLSREEAARYLQALEEGRSDPRHRARGGRRRPLKDW